jgi:lipid-A-disaccharide synthase-like uncharacterized protein
MAETLILVLGFTGQAVFGMRFIVQWLYSEKKKRSVIPMAFWYLSLTGSILLMIYAMLRHDPVFILGQSTGFLVYLRNIRLIQVENRKKRDDQSGMAAAN